MFTDLRATNHFGRPNFAAFLRYIQNKHAEVSGSRCADAFGFLQQREIGVFSCGPMKLNNDVSASCGEANRARDRAHFTHRYETF
jgi:dual oxidase